MKPVAAPFASGVVLVAGAFLAVAGHAEDRDLQAILQKLACVPVKVTPTSLEVRVHGAAKASWGQ